MTELVGRQLSSDGEGFAALTQFFIDDGTLGDTLLKVAQLASDVSPADMPGITMLVDGRRTGIITDPGDTRHRHPQYDSGYVLPGRFRHQQVYRIDAMATDRRWQAMRSRSAIDQAIGILLADGGRTLRRLSSCWSGPYSARTARSATSPPTSSAGPPGATGQRNWRDRTAPPG